MIFISESLLSTHIQINILLTKTTAAQNEVALSYHRVLGLYFLAVVFVANIIYTRRKEGHLVECEAHVLIG